MDSTEYVVYYDRNFQRMKLKELVSYSRDTFPLSQIWSARLSTGIFGFPHCSAGNRGPKGSKEIILSLGNQGLDDLAKLGFVSCSVCHPEEVPGFWDAIKLHALGRHSLENLEDYLDRKKLPFDARRINWEIILPQTGVPNRIYLPQGLSQEALLKFQKRFNGVGFTLPLLGYYDPKGAARFTEYKI